MLTSTRRGLVAALALCPAVVAAQEPAPPAIEAALERAAFLQWSARRDVRTLPDGSVLTSYVGETSATDGRDAVLGVGFVPRFGCAPGIDLAVPEALARRLAASPTGAADAGGEADGVDGADRGGLRDDDAAAFLVDGMPVGYPVLVDADDGTVRVAFNGTDRERVTLRLQLDVGDGASFALVDGDPLTFTLLGSRRTLAAVESLCLTHEPVEPDGDAGRSGGGPDADPDAAPDPD